MAVNYRSRLCSRGKLSVTRSKGWLELHIRYSEHTEPMTSALSNINIVQSDLGLALTFVAMPALTHSCIPLTLLCKHAREGGNNQSLIKYRGYIMHRIAADRALDATLITADHILMRSKRSLNLENNHSYAINLHCFALCIVFTAGHGPSHSQAAARWELILKSNLHQTGRGTHLRRMLLHALPDIGSTLCMLKSQTMLLLQPLQVFISSIWVCQNFFTRCHYNVLLDFLFIFPASTWPLFISEMFQHWNKMLSAF